jgi:RNA polymerase sigma factor (sigma-70 family)
MRESRTDRALAAEFAMGDASAFTSIYWRHVRALHACAYRMLESREDVEEAVQDAFSIAWQKLPSAHFVGESVLPWLLVTCRNVCRNKQRKLARARGHESTLSAENMPETGAPGPGSAGDTAEAIAIIETAVAELSPIDRQIYALCFEEGLSYAAAAGRLDTTTGSIRNRLARIRVRLRAELATLGGQP